jgi:uncharacterized damage-inducible protein DinB
VGPAELCRTLFAYNQWADEKILTAALGVNGAALDTHPSGDYGSLRSTLQHTWSAQVSWLRRWRKEPKREDWPAFDGVAEMAKAYRETHDELRAFAAGLTDEDCRALLSYRDSRGNEHERSLQLLITHVVNHGTYHRGEAGLVLTGMGRSPGDLDFTLFIPEHV